MSKRKKRKFRLYYKAHHKNPAVIVEEDGSNAAGYTITHSPTSGHNKNMALSQNPKKGDSSKAYISKQRRTGRIGIDWSHFALDGYELSEADEKLVDAIEKRRALRLQETQVTVTPTSETIHKAEPKGNRKKKRRTRR